jgi:hypothetical protein
MGSNLTEGNEPGYGKFVFGTIYPTNLNPSYGVPVPFYINQQIKKVYLTKSRTN